MIKQKTWHIGTLILLVLFLFSILDLGALADTNNLGDNTGSSIVNNQNQSSNEEPEVPPLENEAPQKHNDEEEEKEKNTIERPEQQNESKVAYLTFDDGPTQYTDLILNILAKYKVKATFFMLEPQMENNIETLKRMQNEGHAFGLHGVTHDHKQFYQSTESVIAEMNTAQAKLNELTGLDSFLIRTPYGSKPYMKPEYMEAAQEAGYKIWDWNVDSKDWYYQDKRMVSNTIQQIMTLEQNDIQPVILFHDKKKTAEFLPQVLEYLIDNGYTLAVLDHDMMPVQLN